MTTVCLQQFADSTPAGQPGGRPATPGLQSGMVAMEQRRTKKPSYAQVAADGVVSSTDTSSVSPPPPAPFLPHVAAGFLPVKGTALAAAWRVQWQQLSRLLAATLGGQ